MEGREKMLGQCRRYCIFGAQAGGQRKLRKEAGAEGRPRSIDVTRESRYRPVLLGVKGYTTSILGLLFQGQIHGA